MSENLPIPADTGDRLAALKREAGKKKLATAYDNYRAGIPGSSDRLMLAVTKFALSKIMYLEMKSEGFSGIGTAGTAEDYAQITVMGVWKALATFEGDGDQFYRFVHKIAFNQAADFFNELREQKRTKVGLTIMVEGDAGEDEEIDNPEIYNVNQREQLFSIPASITGTDLNICKLIIDGKTYAEAGEWLGMTEGAVKMRLNRLRERMQPQLDAKRRRMAERDAMENGRRRKRGSLKPMAAD